MGCANCESGREPELSWWNRVRLWLFDLGLPLRLLYPEIRRWRDKCVVGPCLVPNCHGAVGCCKYCSTATHGRWGTVWCCSSYDCIDRAQEDEGKSHG